VPRSQRNLRTSILPYLLAVGVTVATLWFREAFTFALSDAPIVIFTVPIFLSAYFGGLGPAVLATVLSALCVEFFVLAPTGSLMIKVNFEKVLIFTTVCVAAIVASEQRHRASRDAARRESDLRTQIEAERGQIALHQSNANLSLALEAGRLGSWELDLTTGQAVSTSRRHDEIFGYERIPADWGSAAFLDKVLPEDRDAVASSINAALKTASELHVECRIRRDDGEVRWIESYGRPFRDSANKLIRMHGIVADVTERKSAEAQIKFFADHDSLTQLPNRSLVKDRITQAMVRAERSKSKVGLLFLDLDNFKTINDSLGHSTGDALLKAIAARLEACVRDSDTVGRLGGDEFLIVLPDLRETTSLSALLEKILEKLSAYFVIDGHNVSTTVSIGVAVYPVDGDNFDDLRKSADAAMYSAKQAGRNTYRFFDRRTNVDADERLSLRSSLRLALERGEFVLHYQPQVDLSSGVVIGAEALIRWRHPEFGLLLPERFISIAEDSGLIVPIGEWVLQEVCRQSAAWQKGRRESFPVAANLSGIQFKRGNLEHIVDAALSDAGLDAGCLELELTESVLISDVEQIRQSLQRLKAVGIRLSIDDFGTGYSSLAYLKRLAVDKIKIDRSFIRGLASDPNDTAIVRAIIQMASSLGLTTIAEGVEDDRQQTYLRLEHCDEAQGFLYAQPLAADLFAATFLEPGTAATSATAYASSFPGRLRCR
jgi:diguanylate cyclase (GGDEF)-like protein/PAS domain S-box-containing protein